LPGSELFTSTRHLPFEGRTGPPYAGTVGISAPGT